MFYNGSMLTVICPCRNNELTCNRSLRCVCKICTNSHHQGVWHRRRWWGKDCSVLIWRTDLSREGHLALQRLYPLIIQHIWIIDTANPKLHYIFFFFFYWWTLTCIKSKTTLNQMSTSFSHACTVLTFFEVLHCWAHLHHPTRGLMPQHHGLFYHIVTYASILPEVHIRPTDPNWMHLKQHLWIKERQAIAPQDTQTVHN